MKNKPKRTRNSNPPKVCTLEGCDSTHYAKGYCRKHWTLFNRNGIPVYKKTIIEICSVNGCKEEITGISRFGMCKFHVARKHDGIDINRPKGNSGELNHMWKGGVAQYPNHYEMKKNRKIVLEEANFICKYCGGKADRIHHIDLSKDNHCIENLAPSCSKCNSSMRPHKNSTSKYLRLYGAGTQDIATWLDRSAGYVSLLHKKGKLSRKINEFFTLTY